MAELAAPLSLVEIANLAFRRIQFRARSALARFEIRDSDRAIRGIEHGRRVG